MFAGKVVWSGSLDPQVQVRTVFAGAGTGAAATQRTASAVITHRPTPVAAWYGAGGSRGLWRERHWLGVADARLDNRGEIAGLLGLAPGELAATSDAVLVCRTVVHWGDAGLARLLGAFAFALWDERERRLTLGRDCLGHRALFYHVGAGFAAFASNLNSLFAMDGVPRELDDLAVADFTVFNLLTSPERTLYRGVARVPSRTAVAIDTAGARPWVYWQPDPDAAGDCTSERDYVERGRVLFDDAVRRAVDDLPHLAISASGGLDSSAVLATAARLAHPRAITCYTLVPPQDFDAPLHRNAYLDEAGKLAALARLYPDIALRLLPPAPGRTADDLSHEHFARTGLPALGPGFHGGGARLFEAAIADGHQVLLTGALGNNGMSWGGPYTLLDLLRGGRLGAFARELRAERRITGLSAAAILRNRVARRAASPAMRRMMARLRGRDPFDPARRGGLNPAFIADHGLAAAWRARGFSPEGHLERSGRDHRLRWQFDFNQFGRDVVALMPEACGLALRDPYADRPLSEFLVAVPERLFRRDGMARAYARQVFVDRLPAEIVAEQRQGAQHVEWFRELDARRDELQAELADVAESPRARRLLDLPRLQRLLDAWPASEAAAQPLRRDYVGVLNRGVYIGRFIRWAEGANR